MGLISQKMRALHLKLNERANVASNSYSATGNFLQYIYYVLVAKNHLKIQSKCSVHKFSFTDIFLVILIMITEQLHPFVAACILYVGGY